MNALPWAETTGGGYPEDNRMVRECRTSYITSCTKLHNPSYQLHYAEGFLIFANTAALLSLFSKSARISSFTSSALSPCASGPFPSAHLSAISCRLALSIFCTSRNLHHSGACLCSKAVASAESVKTKKTHLVILRNKMLGIHLVSDIQVFLTDGFCTFLLFLILWHKQSRRVLNHYVQQRRQLHRFIRGYVFQRNYTGTDIFQHWVQESTWNERLHLDKSNFQPETFWTVDQFSCEMSCLPMDWL